MLSTILMDLLIGLLSGGGMFLVKTYLPAANPLQKSLLKVLEDIPVNNKAIVDIAEELGEKSAKKFLAKKLTNSE